MKVAIAIDAWKLSIFERHLQQSGYSFENEGEISGGDLHGALYLTVHTDNPVALHGVVKAANTEAARTGKAK